MQIDESFQGVLEQSDNGTSMHPSPQQARKKLHSSEKPSKRHSGQKSTDKHGSASQPKRQRSFSE